MNGFTSDYITDYFKFKFCNNCKWLQTPSRDYDKIIIGCCPKCGSENLVDKIGRYKLRHHSTEAAVWDEVLEFMEREW
jgi:hypothetical protein